MRDFATEVYTCLNRRYTDRVHREAANDQVSIKAGYVVYSIKASGPADYAAPDPWTKFDNAFPVVVTYYVDTASEAEAALENIIDDFHKSEWALDTDTVADVSLMSQEVSLDMDKWEEGLSVWRARTIWEAVVTTI